MALSKEEILDAISEMSVIDIVDLISAMEEKFGVSAAAPVAAAAPAAGAAAATGAAAETPNFSSIAEIKSTISITLISAIASNISSLLNAIIILQFI